MCDNPSTTFVHIICTQRYIPLCPKEKSILASIPENTLRHIFFHFCTRIKVQLHWIKKLACLCHATRSLLNWSTKFSTALIVFFTKKITNLKRYCTDFAWWIELLCNECKNWSKVNLGTVTTSFIGRKLIYCFTL